MTVHHARVIALAAVLLGIIALGLGSHLHAQQTLDELRVLAEQGDAEAQFNLAARYAVGRGVLEDDAEFGGCVSRPTREMRMPSTASGNAMNVVWVSRRTSWNPTCGSRLPPPGPPMRIAVPT